MRAREEPERNGAVIGNLLLTYPTAGGCIPDAGYAQIWLQDLERMVKITAQLVWFVPHNAWGKK